jgi:hypothetical protein
VNRLIMLSMMVMCAMITSAQQVPDAPSVAKRAGNVYLSPLRDPAFYIGTGVFTASVVADVHSTKVCEANRTCVEAYRGHDTYRYMAPLVLMTAAGSYGCSLMLHEHHKWRWACLAIPVVLSLQHWKDATTIYHNDLRAKP